jgi:histidinol dehydrogenase
VIKTIRINNAADVRLAVAVLAGRGGTLAEGVEEAVREIIWTVRVGGDPALFAYAEKFDGGMPDPLTAGRAEMKAAYEKVDDAFRKAITHAAENIRAYHEKQLPAGYEHKQEGGVVLGQIVRGLTRVGLYVPGGTAAYPSTVLMNAIPARLAGVQELIMVTPRAELNILAAAYLAGVDRVFFVGGAHAVAALAYGTETIPRVDKIVGPGNVYVATAKRMLYGTVDIEMIAGPSEVLILADETADAAYAAADMLSQAEHDVNAAAVLLTTDEKVAEQVSSEIALQLKSLPRGGIAGEAIEKNGLIGICRSEDEMVALADEIAPEHLEILTADPFGLLARVKNAGSVFLGPYSPEPLGDYYAGTNHVLPTSGAARFASPLGVYDFVKRMSYTYYTREALAAAREDIQAIGNAEGLTAHVAAVNKRFE